MNPALPLNLEFSPDSQRRFGPCDCCDTMTSRVWGYLSQEQATVAAYFVEWTEGHRDRQANFDFIYGEWGGNAGPDKRVALSAAFRHIETGPAFIVLDAITRPVGSNTLAGAAKTRDEVLTTNLREILFAMLDEIYLNDDRIAILTTPPQDDHPC